VQGPGKSWNLLGNDADAVMQAAGAEKLLILLSAVTCIGLYGLLHSFNGPLSRTTRVGRYQKGKTNLDFTEA